MKNKLFYIIALAVPFLFLSSCKTDNNGLGGTQVESSDQSQQSTETKMKKYVVVLNTENYTKYIDLKMIDLGAANSYYFFEGSLSYAYYDDVVINETYSLSTGGYYGYIYKNKPEVTSITGKVIYWI